MANRCAHRKTPNKMFEQTCHTQFRPSEHPEKISNNKKVLYFIRKNWFRLLLSTAVKMVGACMADLIFKKVKKRKSHSSNHVMTNFLMHLPNYSSQSIQPWASARKWILPWWYKRPWLQPKHETYTLAHKPHGIIFMLSCWIYLVLHNLKNWSAAWRWVMRILSRSSIAL